MEEIKERPLTQEQYLAILAERNGLFKQNQELRLRLSIELQKTFELLRVMRLSVPFLETAVNIRSYGLGESHEGFGLENLQTIKSLIEKCEKDGIAE